jgi:ATP-binding cassette subfamily C protein/ATP-binding cassette subfamily C protein LapB
MTVQSAPHPALTGRFRVAATESISAVLHGGHVGGFAASSPFAACLVRLLEVRGWRGDLRLLMEALPHVADDLDVFDVRNSLAALGFATRPLRRTPGRIDPRLLPCLFVCRDGRPMVLTAVGENGVTAFDGNRREECVVAANLGGTAFVFEEQSEHAEVEREQPYLRRLARRFRRHVALLLGMSLMLDIVALIVPLISMVVYDQVIGTRDPRLLTAIGLGVAMAFGLDFTLRVVRSRLSAFLGARFERLLGAAVFARILALPPAYTEAAPVGSQVARLKEFEGAREFFTGRLMGVLLDMPFIGVYLVAIGVLAGALVLIPLALVAAFTLVGLLLVPNLRRAIAEASQARMSRQAFLVEMLGNIRTIKQLGGENLWSARHRTRTAQAALLQYRAQLYSVSLQTASQTLMLLAGAATLGVGVLMVLGGTLSAGGLVATMALVWRTLTPLQAAFLTFARLEQVRQSVSQIAGLMGLRPETAVKQTDLSLRRVLAGDIKFNRVSLRHRADSDPALTGVAFAVKAGQIVGIVGPNGSGKSTILKLICGMHQPQAGSITIDGIDIRQVDPRELRLGLGYLPQVTQLFHGTIAQNMRLAEPAASDEELRRAAATAGILNDISALPEGFDTRLSDNLQRQLPAGFRQRLALARLYVRDCPILLLDEPGQSLDEAGDTALMLGLNAMRGRRTVLMATHRPSHMKLCDRLLVLREGMLMMDGPTAEVLRRLEQGK